jgi:diguanylate cyclase (GGDEF)-like protein
VPRTDRVVARTVTALAALASLAIAGAPPVAYWSAARHRALGMAEAVAYVHSHLLSEVVARNPDLWRFESVRLAGMLAIGGVNAAPEARRLLDLDGTVLAEHSSTAVMRRPTLSARAPVHESGRVVGEVEVTLTLAPAVLTTPGVAVLSPWLGAAVFALLRSVPLRLLDRALHRAEYLAAHDRLTGLPNRTLFYDRLAQALALARREGGAVAVLGLDLDRFKDVNDSLGHAAGDGLLRQVTDRLAACIRESDTLARLGGDEFAVIQSRARQRVDAETLARRLTKVLAAPFDLDGHQASIGLSVGVALAESGRAEGAEAPLRDADLALYQAKQAGRGGFRFFEPDMNQRLSSAGH